MSLSCLTSSITFGGSTMLSQTLQRLIDQSVTTAREIGELTGKAPSTVYRWISGKSEPDFNSIRMLVRHFPDQTAQQAIVSVFVAGTAWQVFHEQAELDVNQDGAINTDDALDAAIQSTRSSGQSLHMIRESCRNGTATPDDTITVVAQLDEVIAHCHIARRILVQECENKRKRRLKLAKYKA